MQVVNHCVLASVKKALQLNVTGQLSSISHTQTVPGQLGILVYDTTKYGRLIWPLERAYVAEYFRNVRCLEIYSMLFKFSTFEPTCI